MKDFEHLTEQEVLALAITAEEEDERFYADVAEIRCPAKKNFPASAKVFEKALREEEIQSSPTTQLSYTAKNLASTFPTFAVRKFVASSELQESLSRCFSRLTSKEFADKSV